MEFAGVAVEVLFWCKTSHVRIGKTKLGGGKLGFQKEAEEELEAGPSFEVKQDYE